MLLSSLSLQNADSTVWVHEQLNLPLAILIIAFKRYSAAILMSFIRIILLEQTIALKWTRCINETLQLSKYTSDKLYFEHSLIQRKHYCIKQHKSIPFATRAAFSADALKHLFHFTIPSYVSWFTNSFCCHWNDIVRWCLTL